MPPHTCCVDKNQTFSEYFLFLFQSRLLFQLTKLFSVVCLVLVNFNNLGLDVRWCCNSAALQQFLRSSHEFWQKGDEVLPSISPLPCQFLPLSVSIFHHSPSHGSISLTFNFFTSPYHPLSLSHPHLSARVYFSASSSRFLTSPQPPHLSLSHLLCHPSFSLPAEPLCWLLPPLSLTLAPVLHLHCFLLLAHPSYELLCCKQLRGYSRWCHRDVQELVNVHTEHL